MYSQMLLLEVQHLIDFGSRTTHLINPKGGTREG
jgi:hypothetical protein